MIFRVNGSLANAYALRLRAALGTITAIVTISAFMPHVLATMTAGRAAAQDLIQYLDLTTDEFTKSNMTRAEIESGLAKLKDGETLDLSAKWLNKLDLSGMDLTRTNLRASRLNGSNLKGAKLDGVQLDAAWALKADFTGASFIGASLFQTQMMDCKVDGANFSNAMVGADFSRATLTNAIFDYAMLGPDLTNHSMGLMRGVLKGANLEGASFKGANLTRSAFEYASLKGANFEGANLEGAELSGADLTGANIAGANLEKADVNSAKLLSLKGKDSARGFDKLLNLDRAFKD